MASNYSEGGRRLGALGRRAIFGAPPSRQEQIAALLSQAKGLKGRALGEAFISSGLEEFVEPGQQILVNALRGDDVAKPFAGIKHSQDIDAAIASGMLKPDRGASLQQRIGAEPKPTANTDPVRRLEVGLRRIDELEASGVWAPERAARARSSLFGDPTRKTETATARANREFGSGDLTAAQRDVEIAVGTQVVVDIERDTELASRIAQAKADIKDNQTLIRDLNARSDSAVDTRELLTTQRQIDVRTGTGQQQIAWFTTLLNTLGVPVGEAALSQAIATQKFQGITEKAGLDILTGMKGTKSDFDAAQVKLTLPQIANEDEANKFLAGLGIAAANRQIEQATFTRKWSREHKRSLLGLKDAWLTAMNRSPIAASVRASDGSEHQMFRHDYIRIAMRENPKVTRRQAKKIWDDEYGQR